VVETEFIVSLNAVLDWEVRGDEPHLIAEPLRHPGHHLLDVAEERPDPGDLLAVPEPAARNNLPLGFVPLKVKTQMAQIPSSLPRGASMEISPDLISTVTEWSSIFRWSS
jgi:hypothetical protein